MGDISESQVPVRLDLELSELFSENVAAKIVKVAKRLKQKQVFQSSTQNKRD